MATSQMNKVVRHLRRSVLRRDGAGLTDGQLLGCFIEHRDEAAFASLVRRHGPMVWGVCRRLLNHHDAEDAFQATILVLVHKAASIQPRDMVANWLYGVAHHAALQARRTAARRRVREKQVREMPEPAAAEQDPWDDLRPLLDQELSRLPDKYRVAIVLCDLEGKARKEVARQLGLPEGTVASRLTRARAILAKRLTQRGVALSGGALAVMLSQNEAGVPTSAVSAMIKAVVAVVTGQAAAVGLISARVAALTEGVLKPMFLNKIKSVAAVTVAMALSVGTAAGLFGYGMDAEGQTEPAKATTPKALPQSTVKQKAKTESVHDLALRFGMSEIQAFLFVEAWQGRRQGESVHDLALRFGMSEIQAFLMEEAWQGF
jgi:RNA polymerase sigma factor (sigma-70 family)